MKIKIIPLEEVRRVFRKSEEIETNQYEHDFKDLKEMQDWIWKQKGENLDVVFFSLYGALAVTTYPRNQKGALLDYGHRYEFCPNCKTTREHYQSRTNIYAKCIVCDHENSEREFKVKYR